MQGQAVPGGIFDELAFMSVIEASKQVPGPRGQGGKFDQAELVHESARARRARSLKTKGISLGTLCFMSNTRYQGDFMDKLLDGLAERPRKFAYYRRMRRYDVEPGDVASVKRRETFRLLVGTDTHNSMVLTDEHIAGRDYPVHANVENVPLDYMDDAMDNPDKVLREVAGISTGAIAPYFAQRGHIESMFRRGTRLLSWVYKTDVDLAVDGMPEWQPDNFPDDRDAPRFIHVDLSTSKDRCGVAIVKVAGYVNVVDPDNPDFPERAPQYEVEVAVSIKPRANHHIDPGEVRTWLMQLGTLHGFEIGGVSYDGYQSDESRLRWKKAGVRNTRLISMDRNTEAFDHFRRSVYQERVDGVASEILQDEMAELEYNAVKDKVDHPPKGSKDLADAVAGALLNASKSRAVHVEGAYVDQDGQRAKVRRASMNRKDKVRPQGKTRRK